MIYPILVYGSSTLKKETVFIDKDYPGLGQLVDDMFETMYNAEGVGIAAPQIGLDIALFVVDVSPFSEDEPGLESFKKVFVNPEILSLSGEKWAFNEGCLSLPGIHEDVWREETVRIRYCDENFVEHEEEFSGIAARVIQHEYDHLQGKVFTDRLSALRKNLVKSKLLKMSKGDFKAKYRCKQTK